MTATPVNKSIAAWTGKVPEGHDLYPPFISINESVEGGARADVTVRNARGEVITVTVAFDKLYDLATHIIKRLDRKQPTNERGTQRAPEG